MTTFSFSPIGVIYSPFNEKAGVPIQAKYGEEHVGRVEVDEKYLEGLKDLDGFSYIHLIYVFDRHSDYELTVKPYMDENTHGLFATRAPKRPNGIGMSLVKLERIEGNIIHFSGVDVLNNTPLLDIKPYYHDFDHRTDAKCGWLDEVKKRRKISDDRF